MGVSLARLSTSMMICFLYQAVPGLGPAHWSWNIWNLCLSALGTVPSTQSRSSELKPNSSVLNNDWNSNVLTPAPTHRPSCFSAPACINRPVYSGVGTSFLCSPLVSTALLFFGAGQVSPPSQCIQPIDLCKPLSLYITVSFVFAVSAEPHKCIEWGQTCRCIDILTMHGENK